MKLDKHSSLLVRQWSVCPASYKKLEGMQGTKNSCLFVWSWTNTPAYWSECLSSFIQNPRVYARDKNSCLFVWSWTNTLAYWSDYGVFAQLHTNKLESLPWTKKSCLFVWSLTNTPAYWSDSGVFVHLHSNKLEGQILLHICLSHQWQRKTWYHCHQVEQWAQTWQLQVGLVQRQELLQGPIL
jgi:hypothetical protein